MSQIRGESQCNFDGDVIIADNSEITLDVLVSGAANNNLGADNCVKAVFTSFTHQFISDLTLTLESPSGDMVTLVGADEFGPNTDFGHAWEIKFFNENELVAIPDPLHDQQWNSITNWLANTTFTGSYYPYQGSLDDITGSVNGIWKLHISDDSPIYDGNLSCFGLVFCNDEGVDIESCSPVNNTLTEPDVSLCEGDEGLNLILSPDLEESYDSTSYNYQYLLFENDELVAIQPGSDLSTESAGSYTFCGMHYFLEDQVLVDGIPGSSSLLDVQTYIGTSGLCAKLSDDCIQVEILVTPEVVTESRVLCMGDSIIIGDIEITEGGIYDILTEQSPCDSFSILEVELVSATFEITQDFDALSCENDTIVLDASLSTIPDDAFYRWETVDGEIITDPVDQIILITKPGIYTYEIEYLGCILSEEIAITAEDDFSYVEILYSNITCIEDSILIDLQSADSIVSYFWDGPLGFEEEEEDIKVGAEGIYQVEFTTNEGCSINREIEIIDERVFPDFELVGGEISCAEPELTIYNSVEDTLGSNFIWIFDDEVLGTDTFQVVSEEGLYFMRVTTGEGCVDSFSVEVTTSVQDIDIELLYDTIDCQSLSIDISYSSTQPGLNSVWTFPNQTTIVDSSFTSETAGTYHLHLSDENGCEKDTSFTVVRDTLVPLVNINNAMFLCGVDSLELTADVNLDDLTYSWTSSAGFSDTSIMPIIYGPGEYYLEVCRENGCCASDTIQVGTDTDIPNMSFEFENLNCSKDTVYIIPDDTSTYDMAWMLDNNPLAVDSNIILVTEAGKYEVEVIDPANGCKSTYTFNIKDDKVDELQSLEAPILNCQNDKVQIDVVAFRSFESFLWSGPSVLDGNIEPFVNQPGQYIIDYTYVNGCSGSDTIEVFSEGELPNLMGEDQIFNCFSDSVNLELTYTSSTVSITWSGPGGFDESGESVIATEPGIYTAYAVAPGACRDTLVIEVVADTLSPAISLVNDGKITCVNTEVNLALSIDANTNSYSFEGPGIVMENGQAITVNQAGVYIAHAIANNGCESSISNTVEISNDFPDYTPMLDSITCVENEVEVGFSSSDPNLQVSWVGAEPVPDGSYDFTTSQAGTYTFTLTNEDGCEISDSLIVVRDTFPPDGSIELMNQITCDQEEANLTIAGFDPSWTVEWSGPGVVDPSAQSFNTSDVGEYGLAITGLNGCVLEDSVTVIYDTTAADIMVIGDPITCLAGKIFLRVDSDLDIVSFEWEGPNDFESDEVEPLIFEEGEYSVTVTSENGCVSQDQIYIVDERDFPQIDVLDYYLPCDGAPAIVTFEDISEGATPFWFGPNDFVTEGDTAEVFVPGEYIGVAVSVEGCSFSDTFMVIEEAILPIFSGSADVLLCHGPIEIQASDVDDDRSILWTGPDGYNSVNNPAETETPGEYKLYVTGTNGCVDSMDIIVEDGRIYPDVEANLYQPFQCLNTEVNLSGAGSSVGAIYSYEWTTDDGSILEGINTLSPLIDEEGTYIINVTNSQIGCVSSDTLVVFKESQGLVDLTYETTPPDCLGYENGVIEVQSIEGGYGPFLIMVDGYDYGERLLIEYLEAGEHNLIITDSLGCEIDTTILIDDNELLDIELPNDTLLLLGQTLDVDAGINLPDASISEILWSTNVPCEGCTDFQLAPTDNMTITLEVIDINGCVDTDEFTITLDRPENLEFPQIFSPNGDGMNDMFYMPMTTGISNINYIRIYDNWGGLLYHGKDLIPGDPSAGWNGTVNGQNAEMAVYIVEALVTLSDGQQVVYINDLTLIR